MGENVDNIEKIKAIADAIFVIRRQREIISRLNGLLDAKDAQIKTLFELLQLYKDLRKIT